MFKYLPWLPGAIFLWLTCGVFQDMWLYWRLSTPISAVVERVEVIEHGASKFELKAYFENRTCHLGEPYHLNRPSAEREAKALEGKMQRFWVDPQKPQIVALEKTFPYKKILYSIVALGVTGYFYFLIRSLEYKANRA